MKHLLLIIYICAFVAMPVMAQQDGAQDYDYRRGMEALEAENYQEAGQYLYKAIQTNDENGYAYASLGRTYHEIGHRGLALNCYVQAFKYLPAKDKEFRAKVHSWRADTYYSLGDTLLAMEELNTAIRLAPKEADHALTHGILHYYAKDYAAAKRDYDTAKSLDSTLSSLPYYYMQLAFAQKDWATVPSYAARYLEEDSTAWGANLACAVAYRHMGDNEKAAAELAKAVHFGGVTSEIYNEIDTLARINYAVTIRAFEDALKQWPADGDPYFAMSVAASATMRKQSALDYMEKYAATKDGDESRFFTGDCRRGLYEFEAALEDAHRAYVADSTNENNVHAYGLILQDLGRYDESLIFFTKALELDPMNGTTYDNRSFSLERLGRMEEALDDELHAAALSDQDASIQYNTGRLLLRCDKAAEARRYLLEAVRLDSVPALTRPRPFALHYLGRDAEARECCAAVLQADAEEYKRGEIVQLSQWLYFRAARFYALIGDKQEALKCLRTALENNFRDFVEIRDVEEFAALQDDADFKALVEEYKTKPTTWK